MPAIRGEFEGRVAVVTGAARGIGLATASRMADGGAVVFAVDVDEQTLRRAVAEAARDRVIAAPCDVSDEEQVSTLVARVERERGRCDILVNNAGIIEWGGLEDLDLASWDRTLRHNLTSSFLCARGFGRLMLDAGSGSIVNVASVAAKVPEALAGSYSASKAGMEILARQIAVEWGPRGIRANTVSPGITKSPMAQGFLDDRTSAARRKRMIASRRFAAPEEMAEVIAFLAGDRSSFVNGQNLEVDGGMTQMLLRLLPHPGVPGFDEEDAGA